MAKFSVGQVWRGKRPAHSNGFVNDRVITYVSPVGRIQYDGPTVNLGRRLPIVEAEVFGKWAGREVGNELPEGEWQRWCDYKPEKRGTAEIAAEDKGGGNA